MSVCRTEGFPDRAAFGRPSPLTNRANRFHPQPVDATRFPEDYLCPINHEKEGDCRRCSHLPVGWMAMVDDPQPLPARADLPREDR